RRRVCVSRALRCVPRGRRADGVPQRVLGAVRAFLLQGRRGARRFANGQGPTLSSPSRGFLVRTLKFAPGNRPRTLAAAIFSGLLFALAFPPFEWVLLLPLALVAWLVALGREQSPGRALLS